MATKHGFAADVIEIHVTHLDRDEQYSIGWDTRHGKDGFRMLRFVNSGNRDPENNGEPIYDWDELYMFFLTIDAAVKAIELGDWSAGQEAF